MARHLLLSAMLLLSVAPILAQGQYKGFDMTRTTDAFELEVPIGTKCVIEETYGSNLRFGKPSREGSLQSTKTYIFDDNGYFINDGEKEYNNTYNEQGLLSQREIMKNGKLYERHIYKYIFDEKGPGVIIEKYGANGSDKGGIAWQNNGCISIAGGGNVYYTLDNTGRKIKGTITVTNYRDEVKISQTISYNDHGYIESTTMSAPGRVQETRYSNYVYDDTGRWIERYSDGELIQRQYLSESEYEQLLQKQREEAEQKRLKELAEKVESEKQKIQRDGYAETHELYSKPIIEVKKLEEVYLKAPISFKFELSNDVRVISYKKDEGILFSLDIIEPAKFKFANDSIGDVPSLISGIISCKAIKDKAFDTPMEVKIDFNKKTGVWYIKNIDKLKSKYELTDEEANALEKRIKERGEETPFKSKKLYFAGFFQLEMSLKSDKYSACEFSKVKTFPIRFAMQNK